MIDVQIAHPRPVRAGIILAALALALLVWPWHLATGSAHRMKPVRHRAAAASACPGGSSGDPTYTYQAIRRGALVHREYGGLRVVVAGDVDGRMDIEGGGATLVIRGDVGPDALLTVLGGGARVCIAGSVADDAHIIASGGDAGVMIGGQVGPAAHIRSLGGGAFVKMGGLTYGGNDNGYGGPGVGWSTDGPVS